MSYGRMSNRASMAAALMGLALAGGYSAPEPKPAQPEEEKERLTNKAQKKREKRARRNQRLAGIA